MSMFIYLFLVLRIMIPCKFGVEEWAPVVQQQFTATCPKMVRACRGPYQTSTANELNCDRMDAGPGFPSANDVDILSSSTMSAEPGM